MMSPNNKLLPYQKLALTLSLVFITLFSVTFLAIVLYGLHDNVKKSDAGVILGSKVNTDGTLSPRLIARLDKGIELYNQNLIKTIIVSGGTGKENRNEAEVMKQYLLTHNIPNENIIADGNGNNTAATAKNSAAIMKAHGLKSVVIISQFFHLTRATLAFKQAGITDISKAHANYFELRDIYSLGRETIGLYYYLFAKR